MSQRGHCTAMMSHMPIFCALYARQMTTLVHHCQWYGRKQGGEVFG